MTIKYRTKHEYLQENSNSNTVIAVSILFFIKIKYYLSFLQAFTTAKARLCLLKYLREVKQMRQLKIILKVYDFRYMIILKAQYFTLTQ